MMELVLKRKKIHKRLGKLVTFFKILNTHNQKHSKGIRKKQNLGGKLIV